MDIIKQDFSKNHYRVVKLFAFIPKKISTFRDGSQWIFLKNYYELQLDSYWGKGWLKIEQSFTSDTWDYKWDDIYLSNCKINNDIQLKYPPQYKNSNHQ